MTCILNQYFATVFTEEDLSDMPVPNMCNSDEVMDEIDTANQQYTRRGTETTKSKTSKTKSVIMHTKSMTSRSCLNVRGHGIFKQGNLL